MNLREAKNKYNLPVLDKYKNADSSAVFNTDPYFKKPIVFLLPLPPAWHLIDGFGLDPKDQRWKAPALPARLQELQDTCNSIDDIWDTLKRERKKYKDEILWLKRQWYFVLNGYWLFINGKPTWISPFQYLYCAFFELDCGLPEYRDRDRRKGVFFWNAYNCTCDENGIEMGHNTCLGVNYIKGRRDGATYFGLCIGYWILITMMKAHCGLQSFDDSNAEEHFREKLIPAWQNMPFFLKPVWDGSTDPKKALVFKKPAVKNTNNTNFNIKGQLGGRYDYATTAKRTAYEGKKLHYYQRTESGKTDLEDVYEAWSVTKECLRQGSNIVGWSFHDTTVYDLSLKGVKSFKELCDDSDFYKRNSTTGLTETGLWNFFIDCIDGREGFVDEYGASVIETPTKPTYDKDGKRIRIGAREFYESEEKKYIQQNTTKSLAQLRDLRRKFPRYWKDCFSGVADDTGMPKERIEKRLNELKEMPNHTVRGNFEWLNGEKDTKVIFKEDPENGRWVISLQLPESESNGKIFKNESWCPEHPDRFTQGIDDYTFLTPQDAKKRQDAKSRLSDGGGCVFMNRDKSIDTDNTPLDKWVTYKTVATYQHRMLLQSDYHEDMLKAGVYYGAMFYPETNVKDFLNFLIMRGYSGYLKYDVDISTGKFADTPGFRTGINKDELFKIEKNYLDNHVEREMHDEYLQDCIDIKGMEDMTKFDRWTACALAKRGAHSSYGHFLADQDKAGEYDISQFYQGNHF